MLLYSFIFEVQANLYKNAAGTCDTPQWQVCILCAIWSSLRYGAVSTSRLPSDGLDRAIQGLVEGDDFDPSLEEDE